MNKEIFVYLTKLISVYRKYDQEDDVLTRLEYYFDLSLEKNTSEAIDEIKEEIEAMKEMNGPESRRFRGMK